MKNNLNLNDAYFRSLCPAILESEDRYNLFSDSLVDFREIKGDEYHTDLSISYEVIKYYLNNFNKNKKGVSNYFNDVYSRYYPIDDGSLKKAAKLWVSTAECIGTIENLITGYSHITTNFEVNEVIGKRDRSNIKFNIESILVSDDGLDIFLISPLSNYIINYKLLFSIKMLLESGLALNRIYLASLDLHASKLKLNISNYYIREYPAYLNKFMESINDDSINYGLCPKCPLVSSCSKVNI